MGNQALGEWLGLGLVFFSGNKAHTGGGSVFFISKNTILLYGGISDDGSVPVTLTLLAETCVLTYHPLHITNGYSKVGLALMNSAVSSHLDCFQNKADLVAIRTDTPLYPLRQRRLGNVGGGGEDIQLHHFQVKEKGEK